jgi:pectinesterase
MRLPLTLGLTLVAISLSAAAQDIHVRVDPHGPGSTASLTDYTTIQQALDHSPDPKSPNGRVIISIAPGTYHERVVVTRNRPRITLIGLGKSPADVVITASQNAASAGGTFLSATVEIDGDAFEADNITFQNDAPPPTSAGGQAVAAAVRSDRAIFKHCRFIGDQDTLFADFGRQYYLDSYIAGGVDFIFGNATAVFDHDEIHEIRPAYLTAQSRTDPTQTTGYVITNSKVTRSMCIRDAPECRAAWDGTFYLGRPWRLYSRVIVMHTELPADVNPEGWSIWHKGDEMPPKAYYAEFENTGPGAATTPESVAKRAPWSHQLTPAEAAQYAPATFLAGPDHWNPLTEAAKLP